MHPKCRQLIIQNGGVIIELMQSDHKMKKENLYGFRWVMDGQYKYEESLWIECPNKTRIRVIQKKGINELIRMFGNLYQFEIK